MEITDEQMEWATVRRMREMLIDVHDGYKVTRSYTLFTTILCWVIQRVRSNGAGQLDRKARSVFKRLQTEQISDKPWQIWTGGNNRATEAQRFRLGGPFEDFEGFNAARFLTALRNATAHGDARNIRPVNRNNVLVGDEFACTERGNPSWSGAIVLGRTDMCRIGVALADRFCAALSEGRNEEHRLHFEEEASLIREEAA